MTRLPAFIANLQLPESEQAEMMLKTYQFARQAHSGQKRRSGEDYIVHPVQVVSILGSWQVDLKTLQAGMLHDVLEDTPTSAEELRSQFGDTVYELVEGVTKIGAIKQAESIDRQTQSIENIRKLLVAMSRDVRVILVKLADRLHNMRTIRFIPQEKQVRIAQETLDVYAPIADRLGMGDVKAELEDLAFAVVQPERYASVKKQAQPYIKAGKILIDRVLPTVRAELSQAEIGAEIETRIKHMYSLHRKLLKYEDDFTKIRDIVAMRIIVDTEADCYRALGIIHSLYKPLPHFIKDYIAVPKPNGYQSLHTTVLGLAHVFEVQIRTHKMHDYAEHGLAAHFQYDDAKPLGIGNTRQKPLSYKKISWVQNLLDWQENLQNTDDIKEGLALDLFKQRIFVFSPKGDLYDLPEGATPVDFAFCLHTQLGLTCRGAKVNNRIVPLDYHLQNRDIVEIFSFSESPKPSRDWLSFVVTAKARSHIKAWYRQFDQTSEERKGQQLLDEYLTLHKKIRWQQITKGQQTDIVRRLGLGSQGELFKALFEAKLEPSDIMREIVFGRPRVRRRIVERLIPSSRKARPAALIPGIDREHISRAGCCSPRYPQAIVGFVSRSGHFRIHQSDCSQLASDRERCVPAYWYFDSSERLRIHGSREYTATILKSLSAYLHGFDAKAHHIDEMSKGDEVQFDVHLSLVRSDKLLPLITALRRLPGVESVEHLVGS